MAAKNKKVWIDLDNSPHVLFFSPIIKELERRGYEVCVTVRDYAQAIGLADLFQLKYKKVGRHYGKNTIMKGLGTMYRAFSMMIPMKFKEKPAVAFSHGSRSQLIGATLVGIPTIVSTDYEFATPVPFTTPTLGIFPEVLPEEFVKKYFPNNKRYPGIKEDVYIQNLKTDESILEYLGIKQHEILVTIRPPATTAHYHTDKSDRLFGAIMDHIIANDDTRVVLLPRTPEQGVELKEKYTEHFQSRKMMIPDKVLDGLNLVWFSDLVISGGGTMIREAAALRVPAYSTFGGNIGSVDKFLRKDGRLTILDDISEIEEKVRLEKRDRPQTPDSSPSKAMMTIVDEVVALVEEKS